jgi:PIN domain nuclease of toxin-antitoxin system
MRLLLDSHALIWALDDPSRLSSSATIELRDLTNELLLSAATVWELAIKSGQGKLTLSLPYRQWMDRATMDLGLTILPITVEYAERQASLPMYHRDPFDRLLIAQALVDGISLVCSDVAFDAYGVTRVW